MPAVALAIYLAVYHVADWRYWQVGHQDAATWLASWRGQEALTDINRKLNLSVTP